MKNTQVARLLAFVTGMVNQQLLLQNEYLVAENRILRAHLPHRLRLTDPQRATLAELGKRLGRKALHQVAGLARPGYHSGLVSEANRSKVRRLEIPPLSWTACYRARDHGTRRPYCTRESWVGIRPNCGST